MHLKVPNIASDDIMAKKDYDVLSYHSVEDDSLVNKKRECKFWQN